MVAAANKKTGEQIMKLFARLDSKRTIWHAHWQDLKDLVRPVTSHFAMDNTRGQLNNNKIFDGTAVWANEQFAAALHSFLTSPSTRWFTLGLLGVSPDEMDGGSRAWLEFVSDLIFAEYSHPAVNFNPTIHESYLDIGSFGTAVLYQTYDRGRGHLVFRAFPLADCHINEDKDGFVDTVYRTVKWSTRQLEQRFGADNLPPLINKEKEKRQDKDWTIIHAVFPRVDRDTKKFTKTNMPVASMWICKETKEVIENSGFEEFPYHAPRWTKLAGEIYGRSPGMNCLPDIKMINQMMKTTIKAAQKVVDPPLLAPDDGFILPLKTSPGSILWHEPGADEIKPLETKAKINLSFDMMSQSREQISRCFFLDMILRGKKKERQTTVEIMDDRNEMLRQMAPMLGRLQAELLGPMLKRSFNLLARAGRIPLAPLSLQGGQLDIVYISPAAMAQEGSKAQAIQVFLEDLTTVAQFAPDVLDVVDSDQVAVQLSELRGVTRKILRDQVEVDQIREDRQSQEQTQLQVEGAKDAASAMKDMATASATRRSV